MKTLVTPIPTIRDNTFILKSTLISFLILFLSINSRAQLNAFPEELDNAEFSILKKAMSSSGFINDQAKTGGYTFFAPTNEAFEALGEETLEYLHSNPHEFAKILKYHFVDDKVYASSLKDGQVVTMSEGTDAFISLFDEMAFINQAKIIKTDVKTFTGVIHIIDAVITQPSSIVDIVVNSPRHTTLEAAVGAAELDGALAADGAFTLFAPTDDAFAALGEETINTLLAEPTGMLAEILKYHVVAAKAMSGDLSDGDMFTTLEGSDIKVTINEDGVFINDAKVIFADYKAPNGVVHVIDAVITPPVETNTVVDVIINSEVHESLEAAVVAAGLADALSAEGPFTVFAPTDDAFAALGQETIDALFAEPTGALAEILKYHVVGASVMAGDLSDGQIVAMLEGKDAFVSLFDGKAYINQAMITITDIEADNGVVHVINAVITQPSSIVDIVVNSPRHSTLEDAVIAAELDGALAADGAFTLFAPTDDAFAALGEETINTLLAEPTGMLAEILKYHVVAAKAMSGDLSDGDMFTTLEGSDIKVTINDEGVFINDAKVIFADYKAPNGVVHVIDAVITPPVETNTVVDVIINSEVHESLEAAVVAAGLADALSAEGPFTVFAPTDDAFAALGQETIDALFAEPTGALAEILKYHVVGASVMAGEIADGQVVEMLEGSKAYISIIDGNAYINQAMITITDIEADNGVVHVIDAVITQPKTVFDLISSNPRLSWLEEAIIAADLVEFFSNEEYFTFFAPTYEAWLAYINDYSYAKSGMDYSMFLKGHMIAKEAFSTDLMNGQKIETMAGTEIEVTFTEEGVMVNGSMIIQSDIQANNGVIHIINDVIETNTISNISEQAIFGGTKLFPNPATNLVRMSFELASANAIELALYDMTGKRVSYRNYGMLPEGTHTLNFDIDGIEPGFYIMNMNSGSESVSSKLRIK